MANQPILSPLDNRFRAKPKGQFTLQRVGEDFFLPGGDYDSFSFQFEREETEVYSNEYPEPTLVLTDLTKVDLTISFVARMRTSVLMEIATLSEVDDLTQDAAANKTKVVSLPAGAGITLPHRDVTIASVKYVPAGGNPVAIDYQEGRDKHFIVDKQSGTVQILKHPDGVPLTNGKAAVTVAYSATAIAGRKRMKFATKTDQFFVVRFFGNSKWPGDTDRETVYYKVQLSGDGEIVQGSDGDEFATISYTGRCLQDDDGRGLADSIERLAA